MGNLLFLQNIGTGEIIIVALVVLLLFGGKKIPELMRGLGKGVKSFKEGMNDVRKELDDISTDIETDSKEEKK
ncbi:MAG: twin-arginine translocase TatA/TatE family subunit [Bacteroidales bacterium]|nr:twin-arginine translocase TatA/TatE family subunit [Bacteroidales bacterium]